MFPSMIASTASREGAGSFYKVRLIFYGMIFRGFFFSNLVERVHGHDHSRAAESALGAVEAGEGGLQRVQAGGLGEEKKQEQNS